MYGGNLALQLNSLPPPAQFREDCPTVKWTYNQYLDIIGTLTSYGLQYLKEREEYILLKEVVSSEVTRISNPGNFVAPLNPLKQRLSDGGVISPLCRAIGVNDTNTLSCKKPFLAPLDVQKSGSIAEVIPSFKVIQSDQMSLNIGFDTEFQDYRDDPDKNRRVLSLQMSIAIKNDGKIMNHIKCLIMQQCVTVLFLSQ